MLYAECICFACGYAIYLDEDGELSAGEITESCKVGNVRGGDTRLCPLSALSPEDQAGITCAVEELPFVWCKKSRVERSFGL
jgi:hypothetical protein